MAEPPLSPKLVWDWYDFLCPFCYAGQDRSALLAGRGFRVVSLPYRVHREIPPEGAAAGPREGPMYALLEREIAAAGLPLRWPPRLPDTSRALAAAEWVRRHAAPAFPRLHAALFNAHFALGEDLGDPEVVDRHAGEAGVDLGALQAALADGTAFVAAKQAEAVAHRRGIRGTPAWLFGQQIVAGLHSRGEFERVAGNYGRGTGMPDSGLAALLAPGDALERGG